MIVETLATLCAGLFAGAAVYVTAVEHPARLSCGPALAVREFGPSYHRGAVMQASLALLGLLTAVLAWWRSGHGAFLYGGLLPGALVPFTLVVILPTNHRLLAPGLDPDSPEAATLLRRWGRLHAVRTAVGSVAFALLVACLARA
jgi:uncharacterized membrane protein